jgi:predicted component of type VI protein secretion system
MPSPITLRVFRGSELLRSEQFSREIIKIGRLATAHLSLEDDRISRIHAVVEVSPEGAVSIIDMGSAEGTFVNGKRVSRAALKPGDAITLGGLRLELGGAAEEASAPAPAAPAATASPAPAPAAPRAPAPAQAPAPRAAVARPAAARPAPAATPAPAPVGEPAPAPQAAAAAPAASPAP